MTVSGYSKKDVYESLSAAFLVHDLERCCCLVAELASTKGEARPVMGFLVDTYARWYACGNLWVVRRLCALFSEMDGGPKKMRQFHLEPDVRRSLCEAVILVASQHRHGREDLWRKSENKHERKDRLVALKDFIDERDGKAAMCLVGDINMNPPDSSLLSTMPTVPHVSHARGKPDVMWIMWRMASDAAAVGGVNEFVVASLDLYSRGLTVRRRPARVNLLCYAVLVTSRRRVRDVAPEEATVAMIARAHLSIDSVYDEIRQEIASGTQTRSQLQTPGSYNQQIPDQEPLLPDGSSGTMLVQSSGVPQWAGQENGNSYKPMNDEHGKVQYLRCITTFDDVLRCQIADERREQGREETCHRIKNIVLRASRGGPAALCMPFKS